MPSLQPYGGKGWTLSCLLPPSSISLYANVLLKLESAQRGISRETLHLAVNSQDSFSAARVFQMLLVDVVLYAVLTWYLDQVSCAFCGWEDFFPSCLSERVADTGLPSVSLVFDWSRYDTPDRPVGGLARWPVRALGHSTRQRWQETGTRRYQSRVCWKHWFVPLPLTTCSGT